ncbi:MAG: hypothetical protein VB024_12550 [Dysgonamonadaceae bacterium]|nr:hypothetical protein [Dysgonamonadaceae bacterium]MEA5082431.1 hypothetical protein [Dysgonamonadaceae bacterium]
MAELYSVEWSRLTKLTRLLFSIHERELLFALLSNRSIGCLWRKSITMVPYDSPLY